MKKVCVITGTRAEYGLLYWTLKALEKEPKIDLQICVTGMHLSPEFGLTYQQIEADGFTIDYKVETLLSSDTGIAIAKSIGLGTIGFADAFQQLQPDIILLLGDRYEILAAATAAMTLRIPIAHCHGGEATEGLIDESIRHSITKMSHLHFTASDSFRKRVIQLGEQPDNVFNLGALGIENINRIKFLSKNEIEQNLNFSFLLKNYLVTFHPETLEKESTEVRFGEVLHALQELIDKQTLFIFTMPNADNDGRVIIKMINEFVSNHPRNSVVFTSMGQINYLSTLKYIDAVIGNSSSGLIEVPSFHIPTINIGDRQRGRIMAESVINCSVDKNQIKFAIQRANEKKFKQKAYKLNNPYGTKNISDKIVDILKNATLSELLKKKFYNL